MPGQSVLQKRFVQHTARLLLDVGKDDFGAVFFLDTVDKADQRVGTADVYERNVTHADDDDFGFGFYLLQKAGYVQRVAEKQRAGETQRDNALFVQNLREVAAAAFVFKRLFIGFDFNFLAHAVHKDNAGEDKADGNAGVEVDQQRQQQRNDQGQRVAARAFEEVVHFGQVQHVPADENQDCGQAGERDKFGNAGEQQHEQKQNYRLHNAGHRRIAAGFVVGGGAGDGAGGGNAGECHAHQVGGAFGDKFGVRVMVVAAHAVDDSGAQQGFDPGEKGDGQSARENFEHQIDVKFRQFRRRQEVRNGTEFGADGIRRGREQRKYRDQQRGADDGDEVGRQVRALVPDVENRGKRKGGNEDRRETEVAEVGKVCLPFGKKIRGDAFHLQAEKVFDLGGNQQCADAGGEAGNDGVGNVFDVGAEAEQAGNNQDDAGNKHGHGQPFGAVVFDDVKNDDDESAGRTADLVF